MKNTNPIYPLTNQQPRQLVDTLVAVLQQNSVPCIWEQSFRCPCVDTQSNSPKPDCPICHGQGWVFNEPKQLDIAITGDQYHVYDGMNTNNYLPSTLATPQITQSGIEDGIKPGDRITVTDWVVPQNYIFNITKSRLNGGVYLPYATSEITRAYTIKDNKLQSLTVGTDVTLDNNYVKVDSSLLGSTISCVLSITKRYYVSMLIKDLRYTHQNSAKQKLAATGNGNPALAYSQLNDGKVQYNGDQIFKMPNQLQLRRETLFFSSENIVANDTDNNSVISDPRVNSFNSFMGGD